MAKRSLHPSARPSATNWKTLKHAQGPATRVPDQIKQLAAPDRQQRLRALWDLHSTLVGEGRWFDASPPAAALLLDGVKAAPEPGLFLPLLADIIGGDHEREWRTGESGPESAPTRAVVLSRSREVLDPLRSSDPAIRAAAAVVVAMLPELKGESLPVLGRMAESDENGVARAAAILAIARFADGDAALSNAVSIARKQDGLPGAAAAVAWLRMNPTTPLGQEKAGLRLWLEWRPAPDADLPWFGAYLAPLVPGKSFTDVPARGLLALARQRGNAGRQQLADVTFELASPSDDGVVQAHAEKVIVVLGAFTDVKATVVAPEELSEEQRALAKRLATTWILPRGGFGVCAAGACRRRWIGLDPPGALDQRVHVNIDGKAADLLFWRAWALLPGAPFPEQLEPLVKGFDRWEALVVYTSATFGTSRRLASPDIEKELSRVDATDEFLDRATAVVDDLARRFDAAARSPLYVFGAVALELTMSALLLLPFVRAKRPLPARWGRLAAVGSDPLCREIVGGFTPDVREGVLFDYASLDAGPLTMSQLANVAAVVDLAPSQRILETLDRKLSAQPPAHASQVGAIRTQVAAVGR
ncbi:MAG: hypothetical protein ABSE49_26135 [Polyangiaceae bacterium]